MLLRDLELGIHLHVYKDVNALVTYKSPILSESQEELHYFEGKHQWFVSFVDDLEEELHEELHLREGTGRVANFVRVVGAILAVFIKLRVQTCSVHEAMHD